MLQLPGIGEYTAAAILCFAFKKQLPVIDTNVKKVIALEFFNGKIPDDLIIKDLAQQLVPIGNAYTWNQALMDYAALVLKKDKIPIPKQKAFKDSNRYYRGKIVKYMISQKTVSPKVLYEQVQDSLDHSRFEDILASLVKDELLILQDDVITLPL